MPVVRARQHGATAGDDRNADRSRALLQQALSAARWRSRKMILAARQRILIVVASRRRRSSGPRDRSTASHRGSGSAMGFPIRRAPRRRSRDRNNAATRVPTRWSCRRAPTRGSVRKAGRRECRRAARPGSDRTRAASAPDPCARAIPGFHVSPEAGARNQSSGIEHKNIDALTCEVPRGHASGGAAPITTTSWISGDLFTCMGSGLVLRMGAALKLGQVGVRVPAELLSETLLR